MKRKNVQKNFIAKLEQLRKAMSIRFSLEDVRNFEDIITKLAHYHYDKRKTVILGKEREFYNWLIENSYNPYTAYRWMLLERIPDDIKFQIKQNRLSQKKALTEAFKRRKETYHELGISIREAGLELIARM